MVWLTKKALAFATLLAVVGIAAPLAVAAPDVQAAARQVAAHPLSVTATYVTDAAQHRRASFKTGDVIIYHIDARNSSAHAIKTTVNFWSDTVFQSHGKLHQYIILDKDVTVDLRPGLTKLTKRSRIPGGATAARYTLQSTVYANADRSDNAFGQSKEFAIARRGTYPLPVPYFSQFAESPRNNECGETSVAMAAAYYVDLYDSAKDWIVAARTVLGISRSAETNAAQLKRALWRIAEMQILATKIPNSTPLDKVIRQIKAATGDGHPVIAFVNARKLEPSRPYSGHWIVITGIKGRKVYINDPDNLPPPQGTGKKMTTTLSLSVYEAAAKSGAVGENQPYGLIVTGESFHN